MIKWVDLGTDNYAGVTYNVLPENYYGDTYANNPEGQRIFIGWMSNDLCPRYPYQKVAWCHDLTEALSLQKNGDDYQLYNYPIDGLDKLLEKGKKRDFSIVENGTETIFDDNFNQSEIRFVTATKDFGLTFGNGQDESLILKMESGTGTFSRS